MKKLILGILLFTTLFLGCFALTSCGKKYTVTWRNWDDEVLERDYELEEGTIPSYDGDTPVKEGDDQYSYEFCGWDKTISAVTGDTEYFARFKEILVTYPIVWQNWDGTVLQESNEEYGVIPSYNGETPIRESTVEYTYTFSGWTPTVDVVTGNTTYVAEFTAEARKYTVTWQNWDGSVLMVDEFEYGAYPYYCGVDPTKQGDAEISYYFYSWSPSLDTVREDVTYTADFGSYKNSYTVTWQNWDGSVLRTDVVEYGTTPTYDGPVPTKSRDWQYTYTFSGWSPAVDTVTGNIIYVAQFSNTTNTYTVTWQNWDGSVLRTDVVEYGTMPTYDGDTPTRAAIASRIYIFSGWSPNVDVVTRDITYRAQFSTEPTKFTVTWTNWDGTVLEVDKNVPYGTTPTYDGETPTRPRDEKYLYTFYSWFPSVYNVWSDVTYTAVFSTTVRKYTVTWQNWDGSVLEVDENIEYGTMPPYNAPTPTKEPDAQYTYKFSGWEQLVYQETGDIIYVAQYSCIVNKYTVTWKNWDGTVLEVDGNVDYGTIPTYDGIVPTKEREPLHEYVFLGWNTTIDAVVCDVAFTAVFERKESTEFVIRYELNGGDGEFVELEKQKGEIAYISTEIPVRNGYIFIGWNNVYEDTTYHPGDAISLDYNFVLYAIWDEVCSTCSGAGGFDTRWSCSDCSGDGVVSVFSQCSACKGIGSQMTLECQRCGYTKLQYGLSGYGPTAGLTCPKCNGSNWYYYDVELCSYCNGTRGKYVSRACSTCNGAGSGGDIYDCSSCRATGFLRIDAPRVETTEYNRIVLVKIDGYQYSMDNVHWQNSNVFEGLHSSTTYTFYQRVAAKEGVPFGVASYSLEVTTSAAPVYKIDYVLNGGSVTNPTTYTIETDDIVLSAPERVGYSFVGWISSDNSEPTKEVVIPSGSSGDRVYTALWNDGNTYLITLDPNCSDVPVGSIELQYDHSYSLPAPEREHHVFVGWYNGETRIPDEGIWTHTLDNLVAKWAYELVDGVLTNAHQELTDLVIPEGVTGIGEGAFINCPNLTSIIIPNSVTSICDSTFRGCASLVSVTIGNGVTSIGDYAFYSCSGLTSVTIGNSVTSIGDYAFYSCSGLTSVTIPDSVTSIGDYAFYSCSGLTSVTIGNGVTSIGDYVFYSCSGLTNVAIPDGVTSIGDYAFYYCSGLTSVTIGNSVTSISDHAFYSCSGLTSVTIGNSVTSIGDYAFYYCSALTSVTIPDGVTSIGDYAFYSCSGLTSVTIPNSVIYIDSYAFRYCTALEEIYFNATSMNDKGPNNYVFSEAGKNGDGIEVVIGKNVTKIPSYLFSPYASSSSYSPKIVSVEFEEGSVCESIGLCAFNYCTSLTSITIPDSVTSIDIYAFAGCSRLISITIPDGVTSIGQNTFASCSSLTSVTIPDGVTSIGQYAFIGCSSLTSVTIPDGVTTIEEYLFYNCSSLVSVTIPDGITSIGTSAFYKCTSLTSITIPTGVTSIGYGAFSYCYSLTSVTIPGSVTSIGWSAFSSCKGLTSLVIENGVTYIGEYAFSSCESLTRVTIPDSVTTIDGYAFYYCTNLKIYCEAASKPSGWNSDWNYSSRPVVWGYKQTN